MIIDDLISNLNKILPFTEVSDRPNLENSKDNDIWRWQSLSHSRQYIILKNNTIDYFYNIKDIVRKYNLTKNLKFSEKYLDDHIIDLIVESHVKKKNSQLINDWLIKLSSEKLIDFLILLPIRDFDYLQNETVGPVKIVKLTEKILKEIHFDNLSESLLKFYNLKQIIENYDTDVFAIIKVSSHEQEAAVEIARNMLERFVFAIRLLFPESYISSQINYVGTIHENFIILEMGQNYPVLSGRNYYLKTHKYGSKYYKEIEPLKKKLFSFLYSENLTSLQKLILSSLYWYGSINYERDSNVHQFLYYIIGLEKILLEKNEQKKGELFGKRLSSIFHKNENEVKFYKKYYDKRNDLVHYERNLIDEDVIAMYSEEVGMFRHMLRNILLDMIEHHDQYKDVATFFQKIYGINR